MDFDTWLYRQWDAIYHPSLREAEDVGLKNQTDIEISKSRMSELVNRLSKLEESVKKSLDDFRVKIFGNGEQGYVEKVVQEEIVKAEDKLKSMIHAAIKEAFETQRLRLESQQEKRQDLWDARTWGLVIIGIGFILSNLDKVKMFFLWLLGL